MEIEYELKAADVEAVVLFQLVRSKAVQRSFYLRWLGYLFGMSALALGAQSLTGSMDSSYVVWGFVVVVLVGYPFYFSWARDRRARQITRDKATAVTYAKRVLRAVPEGLEQISEDAKSSVKWHLVKEIEVTPDHAFVSIDGTFSLVIPKAALGDSQFNLFLDTMRRYKESTQAPDPVPPPNNP